MPFDSTSPANTVTANVERLANALVDGREVEMHRIECRTACCVLGWASKTLKIDWRQPYAFDKIRGALKLSEAQFSALCKPVGFPDHDRHTPFIAQAAASELRRLHAGGEPNPNWLIEAQARERQA